MKNLYIVILIILSVNSLYAKLDQTGSLEGLITERTTRQPLTGVNVIIQNTTLGTTTDQDGKYQIKNLPIGYYQVKVSMIGFESIIKAGVFITSNRVTVINFELNPSAIELNKTIEVTAGYFENIPEKPVSIKTLNTDEIITSPGSGEDIFRIAKTLPGVSVSNGGNANFIVRGGGPDENLTLLENIEISSPLHFGKIDGSFGIISIVNPDLLERAEFISGGFPAEYNGKLSSMFKLELKDGNNSKFNHDVNVNMAGLSISGDGPIPSNGNVVYSVRRGIFDLITSMMGRDAMPRYWDAVAKSTFSLGSLNKISVTGFYYKDNFIKEKVDQESHMDLARKYYYVNKDSYGSAVGLNWNYLFSPKGFMLTTASVTGNGWNELNGTSAKHDLKGEDLLEKEFTLKSEITYKVLPFLEFKGGIQYKVIDSDHKIWFDSDTTNKGIILPGDTINYYPANCYKNALFLQTSINPISSLFITGGIRYDYFSLIKEKVFTPRFSLSWRLYKNITLNAAYGRYTQDPATYQIELSEANKNLTSSKSEQYVIGLENIFRNDIKVSVEGFYKNLSNLFIDSDTSRIITNNESGYARGIEVFLQKKMSDNLVGSISYAYSVSKRKDNATSKEFLYKYDRTHNLNFVSSYRLSDLWQIGMKYTFMSGLPYTPILGSTMVNGNHIILEGERYSERMPTYHQLDIRIDRTFPFKNWTLCVYFDIWNVINKKNTINYSFDLNKDGSATKRAIYDFKIMPIGGISARF